jgi:hypothetical protein
MVFNKNALSIILERAFYIIGFDELEKSYLRKYLTGKHERLIV